MPYAITLHLLAAVIWVGGMFLAYVCLRPAAAAVLEPPQRLTLWAELFRRFFSWVWALVAILILSGHWMILQFGGFAAVGLHVHLMLVTGYMMMALFGHLYFAPFRGLRRAVASADWAAAGAQLNRIRRIVGINLVLGLVTIANAVGGRLLYA
ncbi:MAG: CopD family protein [Oceanospirillaceae bacterium]|nr:CopD family protein [Oceanospirillaceae bacterium]